MLRHVRAWPGGDADSSPTAAISLDVLLPGESRAGLVPGPGRRQC